MHCTKRKTCIQIVAMLCFCNTAWAQFAPVAGLVGTTAISKDSSAFVAWATGCTVQRGPMNIANPSLGLATSGDSANAIGMAGLNGTVSLGDGGTAILTFNHAIYDGNRFDFAVFENGFMTNDSNLAFLELAFVEVSTDGVRYVRFPATSNVQDTTQFGNGGYMDGSELNNLAGKYVANYGTPFDLAELIDSPGIDVNNINYIKVVDVVGSINSAYGSYDINGHIINDPWPTPFASCGFDLDAVGVINAKTQTGINSITANNIKTYPNPVQQGSEFNVQLPENIISLKLYDISGQLIQQWAEATGNKYTLKTTGLNTGIYFIAAESPAATYNTKLLVE